MSTGKRVLLNYDNARPHMVRGTKERSIKPQWELLEHPPYCPALAPSVLHLFGPLKKTYLWQMFFWWRRGWSGDTEVSETTVKKTSMLRVLKSDGTSVSVLVEDRSRNKCFFFFFPVLNIMEPTSWLSLLHKFGLEQQKTLLLRSCCMRIRCSRDLLIE
jgi:hypothetical protein